MIYFDNASTQRPHPVVLEKLPLLLEQQFANPSSIHQLGISTRHQVEKVREQLADWARAKPEQVIFTSGGTEANNMALRGVLKPGDHLISSAVEHASIYQLAPHLDGVSHTQLEDIRVEAIMQAIKPHTKLVSIMQVNNETGHIFNLDGLYPQLKARGIYLHRDAVQGFGKIPQNGDYDFLSLSGHKLGALKGTGALIAKAPLQSLLQGGDQEHLHRAGTENVPGILSLGLVLSAESGRLSERYAQVARLNQQLRELLQNEAVVLSPEDASPYILALAVPGVPSEILLNAMSERGMYFSVGSACSARSKHHSHVIRWLTQDAALRQGALRLSLSWMNRAEEVERFAAALIQTIHDIRKVIG